MENILKVEFSCLPAVNFAMQQNRVSVIRRLIVENISSNNLNDLQIIITSEPDFASKVRYEISKLAPGETVRFDGLRLNLHTAFFIQQTERTAAELIVKISSVGSNMNKDGEMYFHQSYSIDLLSFDQWSGTGILPEMLAAFVTPNNPFIVSIVQRAAAILEQWTGSSALDEYQSRNPNRVRNQMAAVYAAITEQSIVYCTTPASFEDAGQRIRLTDNVMTQKMGNCIDMTLFYASCLEAIGIHPLIVIFQGHAFAGGWLTPETFPDSVTDDISFLNKRIADGINEITLVEATCMNQGLNVGFEEAVNRAKNQMANSQGFIMAIDVKRCRFAGIRPLPQRILNGSQWEIKEDYTSDNEAYHKTPDKVNPYDLSGIGVGGQVTKQTFWERKLLDLSLRNNLLNIRITKNTLQLISADLHDLEDALANHDEFRILAKPSDWDNPMYENFGIYQSPGASSPVIELVKSELTQKRLRSYLSETELNKALVHLYRTSRLSIEENGANTLYISLGLLKWYETPSSERPRYAPLLLLPVEIIRKSAAQGYVIRMREEETMMNITLLEMLRLNFSLNVSGLDPLPTDSKGVDVKLIYSIIRNSIMNQPKWDIEEQAMLGIFSFNKFIMWNDIHNNSRKLLENKIVSSLVNGKIEWQVKDTSADAAELDKSLSPTDIVLPIGADSSQFEAIYEAINDNSFILHGPPGTGKSQTITNIIANALYHGKRVLFVAEKMAALSVVQNRLKNIGLDPFCLELHSNKAQKSSVLAQLKTSTEVVKTVSPTDYLREAEKLNVLRSQLNVYIDALHKKYPFGISMYEAVTRYLAIQTTHECKFPQALIETLDEATFHEWHDAVEEAVSVCKACGHPHNHPLEAINISAYSADLKDAAAQLIQQTQAAIKEFSAILPVINELLGGTISSPDKKQTANVLELINILLNIKELTPELLTYPHLHQKLTELREVVTHGFRRDKCYKSVISDYTDEAFGLPARQLLAKWQQADKQWFIPRYFGLRAIKKQMKTYAINKVVNTEQTLTYIAGYQEEVKYLQQYSNLQNLFGYYGKKGDEDWAAIEDIIVNTLNINILLINIAPDALQRKKITDKLAERLFDGIKTYKLQKERDLKNAAAAIDNLFAYEKRLNELLSLVDGMLFDDSNRWIENANNQLNNWLFNLDKLKDRYQWLMARTRLNSLNIGFIADEYQAQNIATEELTAFFERSLFKAVIQHITSHEKVLEMFKGKLFNEIIGKYKTLVSRFEKLVRQELYAKLAANVPSFTIEAAQTSEIGILQRNIRNNGRGVSIRKLFDQISTILPRLCPCMLMSPISVAQYIDPNAEPFDLIIFDEASQMPTSEAVGAIARGKNVVIVGDPKQMPPTNFFTVNTVEEDNIEIEDLESILDDCLALSMPSKYLLWHYRSKHESLITFSNSEYYDNKLFTFPSPDNIESKVRFISITGAYDKGKTRQNKAEAQAVIDEITRRLSDEKLRRQSIGVVTFSSVQQTLIEDMLSDMFVKHPALETLALESEEPVFIKNLENVQGDERDVILFSVGYGPDAEGRVSMNFGPLNRLGGERRLNVAVSRARYEMLIFSTLQPDMIDLNRSSSIGVAGLKRFLEFAQKGGNQNAATNIIRSEISDIEHIIATELQHAGYTVHTNIGCSGYKIDIGVVDKTNPAKYILGIICDGKNYRQTKTVRDREVVQTGTLSLLGWNILRVWTMDWWENPKETMEIITAKIAAIEAGVIEDERDTEKSGQLVGTLLNKVDNGVHASKDKHVNTPESKADRDVHVPERASEIIRASEKYQATALLTSRISSDDFLLPYYKAKILSQIREVIETEAPLSRSLLCKRIISAWGIARTGQRLDSYLDGLFKQSGAYISTDDDGNKFFWKNEAQYANYRIHRTDSGRDATDLPAEETAAAMKHILEEQISMQTAELMRITASLMGYSRTGTNVEAAMRRGLNVAQQRGFIKEENGKVRIL